MVPPLVAVVGPTASGKSEWALAIAQTFNGEVIGADSRQVYRGMAIGTAQLGPARRGRVPHHLVGHTDPSERYNLVRFLAEARAAIAEIRSRQCLPILAGGTGQYVWALLEGWSVPEIEPNLELRSYMEARSIREGAGQLHADLIAIDPQAAQRIAPTNVRRVIRALEVHALTGKPISSWHESRDPLEALVVAPALEREDLGARIERRVDSMFARGFVDEVRALLKGGLDSKVSALESVGYPEVCRHLAGEITRVEMITAVKQATRKLARRQQRWFRRRDDRIHWLDHVEQALALVAVARTVQS